MRMVNSKAIYAFLTIYFFVFLLAQLIGGQTWDQHVHTRSFDHYMRFAEKVWANGERPNFSDLPRDYEFYGILTTGIADWVTGWMRPWIGDKGTAHDVVYRFLLHLNGFLWSVGTCVLVFRIMRLLNAGETMSILASLFLLLYPNWLGHSFFNYKDLPLAFFYCLALWGVIKSFDQERSSFLKGLIAVALASVGAGAVKIIAIPVMFVPLLGFLYSVVVSKDRIWRLKSCLIALPIALFTLYVVTPVAWVEPVRFIREAIIYMSHHEWRGCTISAGECLKPTGEDWSAFQYWWAWYSVRAPILFLIFMIPCMIFLVVKSNSARILIILSYLLPLSVIFYRNSAMYDGVRHLLFMFPVGVIIIFHAFDVVCNNYMKLRGFIFAVLGLNILSFSVDNVYLYPFNYVYFNEFSREKAKPDQYELDYWGFSLRQAAGRMTAHNRFPDQPLYFEAHPAHLVAPFVESPFIRKDTYYEEGSPYYYIGYTRGNRRMRTGCSQIAKIERRHWLFSDPMNLAFVGYCEDDSSN